MKKIAFNLFAVVGLVGSLSLASCNEKTETTTVNTNVDSIVLDSVPADSTIFESPETTADSVENIVIDSTVITK